MSLRDFRWIMFCLFMAVSMVSVGYINHESKTFGRSSTPAALYKTGDIVCVGNTKVRIIGQYKPVKKEVLYEATYSKDFTAIVEQDSISRCQQ